MGGRGCGGAMVEERWYRPTNGKGGVQQRDEWGSLKRQANRRGRRFWANGRVAVGAGVWGGEAPGRRARRRTGSGGADNMAANGEA
ncbi:hypothetical protein chiPu_0014444 [Chiloscyllium punctatum]|uniref:Uncharacterized protein n=1 Tax=Chiloscyllium punctatum TaxID=137246 RepID=A0A401SZY3_CHIPU|nr:hypothetical protein [Chiloscyllium punctatum]